MSGEYAVDDWIRHGASVNKLALGLVTYSRSFQLQSAAAGQTPGATAVGYPSCPIDSARLKHYPAGCLFLLFCWKGMSLSSTNEGVPYSTVTGLRRYGATQPYSKQTGLASYYEILTLISQGDGFTRFLPWSFKHDMALRCPSCWSSLSSFLLVRCYRGNAENVCGRSNRAFSLDWVALMNASFRKLPFRSISLQQSLGTPQEHSGTQK